MMIPIRQRLQIGRSVRSGHEVGAHLLTRTKPASFPCQHYCSTGRVRLGRVDVVVMRSDAPDIAIELDSAHNAASVTKLEFARDAGALPVWVRWHAGRVHQIDGLTVIDLVDATRHLGVEEG